jgi:hypothetical protein
MYTGAQHLLNKPKKELYCTGFRVLPAVLSTERGTRRHFSENEVFDFYRVAYSFLTGR